MIFAGHQTRLHVPEQEEHQSGTAVLLGEGVFSEENRSKLSDTDGAILSTGELIRRIADEMDRLARLASTVEDAIPGLLVNRSKPASTETLAALQEIDLIAQTVASLSGFLRSITPIRAEDRILIDAGLRTLTLSDLSARLGAAEPDVADRNAADDRGPAANMAKESIDGSPPDIELFSEL